MIKKRCKTSVTVIHRRARLTRAPGIRSSLKENPDQPGLWVSRRHDCKPVALGTWGSSGWALQIQELWSVQHQCPVPGQPAIWKASRDLSSLGLLLTLPRIWMGIESLSVGPGHPPWPPGRISDPAFVWLHSKQAFRCRAPASSVKWNFGAETSVSACLLSPWSVELHLSLAMERKATKLHVLLLCFSLSSLWWSNVWECCVEKEGRFSCSNWIRKH